MRNKKKRIHSNEPSQSRSRSGKRRKGLIKLPVKSNYSSKALKFGALTPSSISTYVKEMSSNRRESKQKDANISCKSIKHLSKLSVKEAKSSSKLPFSYCKPNKSKKLELSKLRLIFKVNKP